MASRLPGSSVSEFDGVSLGDRRLDKRLATVASRLEAKPWSSIPRAMGDEAGVEAAYRFFRNEKVVPANILAPHFAQTWARGRSFETVLSVQDTTEVRFGGQVDREGLGWLMNGGHGFFLHAALLVGLEGGRGVPLGVVAYEALVRTEKKPRAGQRWRKAYSDPTKESRRWQRTAAQASEAAKEHGQRVIHVADREADDFELMTQCAEQGGFVFRSRQDRKLERGNVASSPRCISEALASARGVAEREVKLSSRTQLGGKGRRKSKNPRDGRVARLSFSATSAVLSPPQHLRESEPLRVNLVHVVEIDAPKGEAPVDWKLVTTEPIESAANVLRIIDIYRARWLIEEFWKGLKTGCAYEQRQLESLKTLETALAIFLPIVWHILALRTASRETPGKAASTLLTAHQLAILRTIADAPRDNNPWGLKLPEKPSVADALSALARIGGHLRQNGPPGWLILRRGYDTLLQLELAARLFRPDNCDQS